MVKKRHWHDRWWTLFSAMQLLCSDECPVSKDEKYALCCTCDLCFNVDSQQPLAPEKEEAEYRKICQTALKDNIEGFQCPGCRVVGNIHRLKTLTNALPKDYLDKFFEWQGSTNNDAKPELLRTITATQKEIENGGNSCD